MTSEQLATLKAAIEADPVLAALPMNHDTAETIAEAFNQPSSPPFSVWRTTTTVDVIQDNIAWQQMTPSDAPDITQIWANRALQCQGKQFNLQNLLIGKVELVTGKANIRTALQDCLTNLPAGTAGANVNAGWANVRLAIQRIATRAEKLFATGTGTSATPGVLVFEGSVTGDDVQQARELA